MKGDTVTQVSKSRPGLPGPEPALEADFVLEAELRLECGRTLINPTLRYAIYGELNAERDNAVLVGHALSGSALAGDWWPGLFVDGGIVDLQTDSVLCVNLLGSCYGSTGPASVDPETGESYGPGFPLISIRDNVRAQALLADSLGIDRFKLAIGGSIGGMQALEWAILFPKRVKRAVIIAVAPLGAMGLALNHLQRRAIMGDPDWAEGRYIADKQPRRGLALARETAMLSYKSSSLFEERFGRKPNRNGENPWAGDGFAGGRFDVAGFLDYQGERFLERFDANSYLAILRMMDLWDPCRDVPGDVFGRIEAELVFIGISSDWLFAADDVRRLAEQVRSAGVRAEYREMVTEHGHDAFLAEQAKLVLLLRD